jgi:hypothetical protein
MAEIASSFLGPWSSFYIMTGSSAASLTGLMFVVITLVMGTERIRRNPDGISTFSTPTVVHFGAALLVSAILIAPWRSMLWPATLLGLAGLCGVVYISRLTSRAWQLSDYKPDLEDWASYTILPFIAYGAILAGAIMLALIARGALFAFAGGVMLLIFIGIHNAWDIVTFLALGGPERPPRSSNDDPK